ncbi:LysM peptidoglycan-binding domain-containing protein [Chitinophaga lutea]|uniref:Peptidoglycan hydrolase n=1 Tax=Chitinophaga lutea TaxID=2488634 RepID=A0A3N4Q1H6_9BACT|nr:glucosaminidase domain-containing protein [Chitinophaga lutea]RPE09810.1 LysM peptidoglycan-binding domain-containing protein [Chitinophaga lutea]
MQVKSYCLAVCLVICGVFTTNAQSISTDQYIDSYKNIAMEEMRRSGVPAAIKLAQGILETQSGNGWLVLNSNNHFGIKCKNNWAGQSVNYDDDEKQECFRKYGSATESWRDHSEFLRNNPRYRFLFDLNPEDYKAWAYGLKTAGYATSRTYPQQLIQIIERYNLQQYNALAMSKAPIPTGPVFVQNEGYEPGAPQQQGQKAAPVVYAEAPKPSYPKGPVFKINGRKVIYVEEGTALIQIANDRDIRLSSLLKYNDLAADVPLEKDMLIFLQSKSKRGQNDYHTVAPGESLHDIAQAEGVQMRWLRKRNKMQEGEQPAAGERIALDGYASAKPKLGSNTIVKVDEHKDLEPRKIVQDIKTEIEKARNTAAETAQGPAAGESVPPARTTPPARTSPPPSGIPPAMMEDLKKAGGSVTPAGNQYHTVTEKETLYSISRRYSITVAQLQQWNNLQDNGIKIGQQLIVRK